MKYLVLIFVLPLLLACSKSETNEPAGDNNNTILNDDSSEIPKAVMEAFKAKFPDVTDVEWEVESDKYEVEFMMDSKEYEAEFDKEGNWLSTENEISKSEIPEQVINSINTNYEGYDIKEAEFVTSAEYGELYEVMLEMLDKQIEVAINKEGKVLFTEDNDDEENKDEDKGKIEDENGGADDLMRMINQL